MESDPPASEAAVFDFFISYKHRDAHEFAPALKSALEAYEAEVWLDSDQMHPGDSLVAGIESGIQSSIDAIVILSENYLTGWSEAERSNLYALMVSKRLRIVPIWFQLEEYQVQELAPMFAGLVGIKVADSTRESALTAATEVMKGYKRSQRRSRLFELFFRAVRRHVDDPDIDLFLAASSGDVALLQRALDAGGDPNQTDGALWNKYNKIITEHADVFPAWRRLFLWLSEEGAIGSTDDGSGAMS